MAIDPVLVLAEELRIAEKALEHSAKAYREAPNRKNGQAVCALTSKIRDLCTELLETKPTSVLGAGVLLRMAADRLPFAYASYARHFHEVADRLEAGQRDLADLIWLRGMRTTLAGGLCGQDGAKIAPLVALAIMGIRQPVVVYRAVLPAQGCKALEQDIAVL